GPPEQGGEQVVAAPGQVERLDHGRRLVVLRRAPGAGLGAAVHGDFEVPAGGQLVEVVAGDVRVQRKLFGDCCGRDAVFCIARVQVDVSPGGVAEGGCDRGNG